MNTIAPASVNSEIMKKPVTGNLIGICIGHSMPFATKKQTTTTLRPVDHKKNANKTIASLTVAVLCLLLTAGVASSVFSQHELNLSMIRHTWQSGKTNPAIVPEQRLAIELPGFRNHFNFDGPVFDEILTRQGDKKIIDISSLISKLKPENLIRNDFEFTTIGIALRLGGFTLSAGHALQSHAYFKYPKTLPQLLWEGNAQFIGQEVSLGNELQVTNYHQFAVGMARSFGPLTMGIRGKFLSGIADASTHSHRNQASLYTDPDVYQITLAADYLLHSARSVDYRDYEDFDTDFRFGQITLRHLNSGNHGWAFDLGARLQAGKWDIAAGVADVGKVHWKQDVQNYLATKTWHYEGLDFSHALTGGDLRVEDALDTLRALFKVESNRNPYSNSIPVKIYGSAVFNISEKTKLSGGFALEYFRNSKGFAAGVGIQRQFFNWLNAGASYSINHHRTFDNIGLNVSVKAGPLQLLAVTEHLPALLYPGRAHFFSARFGSNLLF